MMSNLLCLVLLGICATGAIAGPGILDDSWRSNKDEQGDLWSISQGNKLNAPTSAGNDDIYNVDSGFDIARRFMELEKRLDETRLRVDKTDLGLSNIQRDVINMKSLKEASFTDGSGNSVAKRNADLRHTVSRYVNESLMQFGVESFFGGRCQSGTAGVTWYRGIENTWPRMYTVKFNPPFKNTPQFMYGIVHLDSSFVRVDISLQAICNAHAVVRVGTWEAKDLFGVKFRWMACP